MNWKSALQVRDLDRGDRLELTCRKCGHMRYLTGEELHSRANAQRLWLDEIERRARCRQRGCSGTMRLAWPHRGDTSGFVGGIA